MNTRLRSQLSAHAALASILSTCLLAPVASLGQSATPYFANGTSSSVLPTYYENLAFGYQALHLDAMTHDTVYAVAIGYNAMENSAATSYSIGLGYSALAGNTDGADNIAIGYDALPMCTVSDNIAIGYKALKTDVSGGQNVAAGSNAMLLNIDGSYNTAIGYSNLSTTTSSTTSYNVAEGTGALLKATANSNTALGYNALTAATTGGSNVADGAGALSILTTGSTNIGIGYNAGSAVTTGGSNNIEIGNVGASSDSGVIYIGTQGTQTATYIAGISGATVTGNAVYVDTTTGQLGTSVSSRRFKYDINDMGAVSDRLMQLRPVSFRYKKAAGDGDHRLQYGLIAEEVAKVCPELVMYDKQGQPYTVYYHVLTPMILNELQKENHKSETLQSASRTQDGRVAAHGAQLVSLNSKFQRQGTELASLKQAQQQQDKALASLEAALDSGSAHTASVAQR